MNRITICFQILLMFFTADATAQKKQVISIEWKIGGTMPSMNGQKTVPGFAGPVSGIDHGMLIVGGGSNFPDSMPWAGGKKKYYDQFYVFQKNRDDSFLFLNSFSHSFPIAYSATCNTDRGILSAGGENENGLSNKVFLVRWDQSIKNIFFQDLPDLPFSLTNASAVYHDHMVYVAGGEMKDSVSGYFLRLNLENISAGWTFMPDIPFPVSHTVMLVQSDGDHICFYLVGGRKKNPGSTSDFYATVLQFDVKDNRWNIKRPMPYSLSAGTGIATGDHSLLIFGGDNGETFHQTEKLLAAIESETDAIRKKT